jgi:hypothetical protein
MWLFAFNARLTISEGRSVTLKVRTVIVTFVMGIALFVSACTSSSTHSATHASPTPHNPATTSGFQAGSNPCRLVTAQDIFRALSQRMTEASRSRSTCSYVNASSTDHVTITTAKMTPAGAKQAVTGTAHTVKVKVHHLRGVGDTAVAYLTKSKNRSVATCLFARNGEFIFLLVGSQDARGLMPEAITLAKKAAGRA